MTCVVHHAVVCLTQHPVFVQCKDDGTADRPTDRPTDSRLAVRTKTAAQGRPLLLSTEGRHQSHTRVIERPGDVSTDRDTLLATDRTKKRKEKKSNLFQNRESGDLHDLSSTSTTATPSLHVVCVFIFQRGICHWRDMSSHACDDRGITFHRIFFLSDGAPS